MRGACPSSQVHPELVQPWREDIRDRDGEVTLETGLEKSEAGWRRDSDGDMTIETGTERRC